MVKYIIIFFLLSNFAMASTDIDCSEPKNVNKCAKISYSKSEINYNNFIKSAVKTFKKKTSPTYVASFLKIENRWKALAKSQCTHLKKFYQGGSLGTSSYITCLDVMYDARINVLKTIYDDILGER